jgi:hypothetical protein
MGLKSVLMFTIEQFKLNPRNSNSFYLNFKYFKLVKYLFSNLNSIISFLNIKLVF